MGPISGYVRHGSTQVPVATSQVALRSQSEVRAQLFPSPGGRSPLAPPLAPDAPPAPDPPKEPSPPPRPGAAPGSMALPPQPAQALAPIIASTTTRRMRAPDARAKARDTLMIQSTLGDLECPSRLGLGRCSEDSDGGGLCALDLARAAPDGLLGAVSIHGALLPRSFRQAGPRSWRAMISLFDELFGGVRRKSD